MALFDFDRAKAGFVLRSVHPGVTVDNVRVNTGFAFDAAATPPVTPNPDAATRALLRGKVFDDLAETYPAFARTMSAETA